MKKIIVLALTIILVFAFCACGGNAGDDLTDQTVAAAPNAGNLDVGTSDDENDIGTSDEGTSSGDLSTGGDVAELIPSGDYYCYDRFSGEGISGFYIRIHSSNSSQVVFDYVTSAGTFTSVTAYLDSGYNANVNLTDTLSLTMTFSNGSITVDEIEGMGFAIPIEYAMSHVKTLEAGEKVEWPLLGIEMVNVTDSVTLYRYRIMLDENIKSGVVVLNAVDGSGAKEAGLKKGDVIIKFAGKEVKDFAYLRYELYQHSAGDVVEVTYLRDGKEKTTKIKLGKSTDQ